MIRSWKNFINEKKLFVNKEKIINPNSEILSFGSCFAVEIRKRLRSMNFKILPNYFSIDFNNNECVVGKLPNRDNINHYNTYTVLYEFMRFDKTFNQPENDYWEVHDRWFGNSIAYQDPYRRAIYAKTKKQIIRITKKINKEILESIKKSEIIIITLGLTEVWIKKDNKMISCMNPGYAGGGGKNETFFYVSSYEDNLNNLRNIMKIINKKEIKAKVIFTVSPVPLGQTFRNLDVTIANEESKSILRVAASEIIKEFDNAYYFPAYEFCKYSSNVYEKDGRHIKPEIVDNIIKLFKVCFL